MAKTIQVRVDDNLKDSVDLLFTSLGLDTSTAVRMFLIAAIEARGIPFPIVHNIYNADYDTEILKAINYRKSGGKFLTVEQSLSNMKNAIITGTANGK